MKQSDRASVLLKALRHRIEVGAGPIHGYEVAAKIIGWESDASIGRAMAQVCRCWLFIWFAPTMVGLIHLRSKVHGRNTGAQLNRSANRMSGRLLISTACKIRSINCGMRRL